MTDEFVRTSAVQFILTSDGRLGVGYCPDKEAGGFSVIKWCPEDMIKSASREILFPEAKP